jgi:hypothetical protein
MVYLKAIVAYNQTGQKVTLSDCQVKQKNEVQDLNRYRVRDRDLLYMCNIMGRVIYFLFN